jgi:diguanylate cyclase (GGDEF)-like protein/PAS domain S-box-containing protein
MTPVPATAPAAPAVPFRVLLVEDNPGDVRLIARELGRVEETAFEVRTADRIARGVELLASEPFDLVLLDLSLPDCRGLANLDQVIKCRADVPVVVITGLDDDALALDALRRGAQDYLIKGKIDRQLLARTVRYASERSLAAARLRAATAKFKLMFEASPVGFVFAEMDGQVLEANAAFGALSGYMPATLAGHRIWELLRSPGQPEHPFGPPEEPHGGPVEMELHHAAGRAVPVSVTWAVVDEGTGQRVWFTLEDLSHYKVIEQRLLQLSMYDGLTGLANRNLFHAALVKALARAERNGRMLALMMLDLDRFKAVNDTMGHEAGDALLQDVAQRLSTRLRSADQFARIGGDEFAVILEGVERLSDVAVVARKVISAVAPPFTIHGKDVYIGVSVGIAGWPEHATDAPALQRAADLAMYAAKSVGGNAYRFYSELIRTDVDRRTTLENELRRAHQYDEFVLHYQPVIETATGRITGAEALLRWQHPERGLVAAAEFIEGLESSGQIEAVGRWVLENALAQLEIWHARFDPRLTMAINLSARQLLQGGVLTAIVQAVEDRRVDLSSIELEVTESTVVTSAERQLLNELHALGVRITVDDFGTGYSSLQYLKLLPIQALKIDGRFVAGIPSSPDDVAIVGATLALARGLGLEVVAEGVETSEQYAFLRERGCHRAQGYLIGRPMSAEAFEAVMHVGSVLLPHG